MTDSDDFDILALPEEVLVHVLRFVDAETREEAVFVCHKFYEAICWVERKFAKPTLTLSHQQIFLDDTFASIVNSRRKFQELSIDIQCSPLFNLERLEMILKNFAPLLKKLTINSAKLSEAEIQELLFCVPDIEELCLCNVEITLSTSGGENEEMSLHKLRKLEISGDDFAVEFLEMIPRGVLREVKFSFPSEENSLEVFFERQRNIKALLLYWNGNVQFHHLNLERFGTNFEYQNLQSVIRQLPLLRTLDLGQVNITEEDFAAICELKKLEILKICGDNISQSHFKCLQKLEGLKELHFISQKVGENSNCKELCRMQLPVLEKLSLICRKCDIPLVELCSTFLNLKHIKVICHGTDILSVILAHFSSLETISLEVNLSVPAIRDCDPQNLKELVIKHSEYINFNDEVTERVVELINGISNLERIQLPLMCSLNSSHIKSVVESHSMLTHLVIGLDKLEIKENLIEALKAHEKLTFIVFEDFISFVIDHEGCIGFEYDLEDCRSASRYIHKEMFGGAFSFVKLERTLGPKYKLTLKKKYAKNWVPLL